MIDCFSKIEQIFFLSTETLRREYCQEALVSITSNYTYNASAPK